MVLWFVRNTGASPKQKQTGFYLYCTGVVRFAFTSRSRNVRRTYSAKDDQFHAVYLFVQRPKYGWSLHGCCFRTIDCGKWRETLIFVA